MMSIPADLRAVLEQRLDSREYKRALAVKLALQHSAYAFICAVLAVTPGYISQQKNAYEQHGVEGLRLKHTGAIGQLSVEQRQEVVEWLKQQNEWSPQRLRAHLETTYQVMYDSPQSSYSLLQEAKITYKKAQARNPKRDGEQVAAKKKK